MVAPYVPIQDIVPWTQAIAGLNQTIYSTTWTANDSTDILVYSRAPNVPTSDVLQLIPTNQYTVQFIGPENVVQVTFGLSYIQPQYNIITIMRDTPSEFLNLYTNTNFTPSMLNGDFETLTQIDQQNQLYWQQIVPRYNNSATVNVPIDTILPILKANEFWIKNPTNTAFIAATLGDDGQFPVLGPFVLYALDSNYPEGFSLGSLASGALAQNVALGISTPYVIPFPYTVSIGGTGLTSITPYSVLLGGATSTANVSPLSDIGDIGEVLTSSGPGAPPSFQPIPAPPSAEAVPVGTVIDYAGTSLPVNFLACDGSAISRTTYSALFTSIGITWGAGDASTTFNLPNLQGFTTAGSGGTLPPISNTVGSSGGAATYSLTANDLPSHTHAMSGIAGAANNQGGIAGSTDIGSALGGANTLGNTTTHTSITIVQPTAIVQKLIKYQ